MDSFDELLTVTVPPNKYGNAVVDRFEIDEEQAARARVRSVISGSGRDRIRAGVYTRLMVDGVLWMSDTPSERDDHQSVLYQAQRLTRPGSALVTGLGLGMVVGALIKMPTIHSLDVVEIDPNVVGAVGSHYCDMADEHGVSFEIHLGSAHEIRRLFGPSYRWDIAWHDIWPTLCETNLDEMSTLKRRYAKRVGWQGCWGEEWLRARRRRERRYA